MPTARQAPPSPNAYWLIQAAALPRADVKRVAQWICQEAAHTVMTPARPAAS
ncbi:protein of unknown function (plasmid) [Cupriavidus taiwanensis]|nr:protein of unknown function [Cupriavidus taiwanensis]